MNLILFGPKPPPIHGVSLNLGSFANYCSDIGHNVEYVGTNVQRDELLRRGYGLADITKMGHLTLIILRLGLLKRQSIVYLACATKDWPIYRDIVLALILRLCRRRFFVHIRGTELADSTGWLQRLVAMAYAGSDKIYTCQALADEHRFLERPGFRTHVVANGVPDHQQVTLYERFQFTEKHSLRLLFLSNFLQAKGVYEFIETLAILQNRGVEFVINLCGFWTPQYSKEKLRSLLQQKGLLHSVGYIGPVNQAQKRKILSESDVLIFPSHRESFGNVVIEAMSAGVVVIANRTTAMGYILDEGRAGILLDPFIPGDAALALQNLSPLEKRRFAIRARRRYLKEFTLRKQSLKLMKILEGNV